MPGDSQIYRDMGGEPATRKRERAIAEVARRQHGVVSRPQLVDLGFGSDAIDHRLRSGRLHVVHRRVYAVGHRVLTQRGRWMAAVLAGGQGAVLSFRASGCHWGLGGGGNGRVDVTVPRRTQARRGIHFHEMALPADERTQHEGIPITTVARTLFDLASVLTCERLEQAIATAERLVLADTPSLPELMERYPRRRGLATLRSALGEASLGRGIVRSDLEVRFLEFLSRHQLPLPEVNVKLHGGGRVFEVDCLWADARLVAEVDSRQHHLDRVAFEADRARDRALVARGYRCIRVTSRQLTDQPERLAADLRAALLASRRFAAT